MKNIRFKQVFRLYSLFLLAVCGFLFLTSTALASPCPVRNDSGTGHNTLPYAISEHNVYGSCDYNGSHLIYFDEDLDGETITITSTQTITRSSLTIGDNVVAVSINATAITSGCVFRCNHETEFVNITSLSISEGVDAFCGDCVENVDVNEVAIDCAAAGLADTDGDGVCDNGPEPDNCISISNPSQTDSDGDGYGNACDNCDYDANEDQDDFDGDGIGDVCDNCPYNANFVQIDSDGDDVGNVCDNCPDDANAAQLNTDGDEFGNACDEYPDDPYNQEGECLPENDSDGDGLCDENDDLPNDPSEQYDSDGDGIGDNTDNCVSVSNASQLDTDGDGQGDACDSNDDNDDLDDWEDNCPTVENTECSSNFARIMPAGYQLPVKTKISAIQNLPLKKAGSYPGNIFTHPFINSFFGDSEDCWNTDIEDPSYSGDPNADDDGDGVINYCDYCPDDSSHYTEDAVCTEIPDTSDDADLDGVIDTGDNCNGVFNPDQADADSDGLGDACDDDADGDGYDDHTDDNCPSVSNPDQADSDGDGVGDVCDDEGADTDGDGMIDSMEAADGCDPNNADTDGDGIDDGVEILYGLDCAGDDTDGDGISDGDEGIEDTDGDGIINALDSDSDNDGISDAVEMSFGDDDADNDGIPNYLDTDSDGDGIPDKNEKTADANNNGVPDFIDSPDEEISKTESEVEGNPNSIGFFPGTPGNGCALGGTINHSEKETGFFLILFFFVFSLVLIRNRGTRRKSTLFILVITAGLFLASCGGNEDIPEPEAVSEDETINFFPHAVDWKDPNNHGVTALGFFTSGADATVGETCQSCHGSDLKGGSVGVSCYDCHTVFPHPADWVDTGSTNFHGLTAIAEGIEITCGTQCHGTDLSGGLSNKSCYSCHPLAPHFSDNPNIEDYFSTDEDVWRDFSVHGAYVQDNNAVVQGMCSTNCHGSNYTGGLTGITCYNCHAPYPHSGLSDNWINYHRTYVNQQGDGSCSTDNGCHTNKNFGPSTVVQSCTDFCHQ